nr:PREDICTED: cinnamoyl-CoA reductase 1-like isoform X1 [Nicotiana tabacum]
MANRAGEVVCVTGGSGYIGSWLVRFLLERGYTVHATVKDLNDEKETKHLLALEGAESRLLLFQIDLINYDSIVPAITGAVGVFHLASPCIVDEVKDPENQLLSPAIKGTMNVLTASKELGVKRVVVTSSISAIIPSPNWPADRVKNEDCWTDIEYCKQKGVALCWTSGFVCFTGSAIVFRRVGPATDLVYEQTSRSVTLGGVRTNATEQAGWFVVPRAGRRVPQHQEYSKSKVQVLSAGIGTSLTYLFKLICCCSSLGYLSHSSL